MHRVSDQHAADHGGLMGAQEPLVEGRECPLESICDVALRVLHRLLEDLRLHVTCENVGLADGIYAVAS